jgi:hypothetical protein
MSVGLDALQMVMLALAVGCGAPALIYLAFKGTLRNEKKAEPKEIEFEPLPDLPTPTQRESQQQLEPGSHVYASVIGFARIEDSPPLPARITIYVPVKYAEQIAEKLGWIKPKPKPSQAGQKPPKADEKPPAKPIIRRIGVEYGMEGEKGGEG